jgi:hypothetical protein
MSHVEYFLMMHGNIQHIIHRVKYDDFYVLRLVKGAMAGVCRHSVGVAETCGVLKALG